MKKSSACNYLWEIEESPVFNASYENTIPQSHVSPDGETILEGANTFTQDSVYVRYAVDYIIVDDTLNKQQHIPSYKFVKDFEIKDFKVIYNPRYDSTFTIFN